jgi:hemoglobin
MLASLRATSLSSGVAIMTKHLFLTLLLVCLLGTTHVARVAAADDDLYNAFGGKTGLAALMDDFVSRLVVDSRTKPFFEHADLDNLKTQLTDQLCALSGGPCQYGGRDMKTAHQGMGVRASHFNALVEVLQQSMDAKEIPFTVQNRMLALLAPMHRDVITK